MPTTYVGGSLDGKTLSETRFGTREIVPLYEGCVRYVEYEPDGWPVVMTAYPHEVYVRVDHAAYEFSHVEPAQVPEGSPARPCIEGDGYD